MAITPDTTLRISISIVVHCSNVDLLATTVMSLAAAIARLRDRSRTLVWAHLSIVDNGASVSPLPQLGQLVGPDVIAAFDEASQTASNTNLGYGAAHNRAAAQAQTEFHLVLNPDVELDEDALCTAVDYLAHHPEAVCVVPHGIDTAGRPLFLAKRYPSMFILLLRGLTPGLGRRVLRPLMDSYELRDMVSAGTCAPVELASGCFMFLRTKAFASVGGFSPAFFLYFEDFDLSIRLREIGDLVYVPAVRVVHHGGHTARKGIPHVFYFMRSARTFFRTYGWRMV